jgi:hypothetical protein
LTRAVTLVTAVTAEMAPSRAVPPSRLPGGRSTVPGRRLSRPAVSPSRSLPALPGGRSTVPGRRLSLATVSPSRPPAAAFPRPPAVVRRAPPRARPPVIPYRRARLGLTSEGYRARSAPSSPAGHSLPPRPARAHKRGLPGSLRPELARRPSLPPSRRRSNYRFIVPADSEQGEGSGVHA